MSETEHDGPPALWSELEHQITVTPDEDEGYAYDIDHGRCTLRGDECLVETNVRELGVACALNGVWSEEPVRLGTYVVTGWVSKFDVPGEPIEYDAGIEIVSGPTR